MTGLKPINPGENHGTSKAWRWETALRGEGLGSDKELETTKFRCEIRNGLV